MLIHEAFDKTLKQLDIKAQEVCDRSGVSHSRLSQFRSGKGSDIGVRSLDALLDAAESLNPAARRVFAELVGGRQKSIEEMTTPEKADLIIALACSLKKTDETSDPESLRTA